MLLCQGDKYLKAINDVGASQPVANEILHNEKNARGLNGPMRYWKG